MQAHSEPLWSMPTRAGAIWFWLRSRRLIFLRGWRNLRSGLRRWPVSAALAEAPILAQLRVPLWTDGRDDEFALVAGKVQNLRIAARALNGVVTPAGHTFSFWQQIGRPVRRRGYVLGREVRAGCVIPAIAGGICQLSNTLSACARRAGFELLERHGHSARIEQTEERDQDADATVFWNYVDLRLRANVDWRLEATLTSDELVVTLRAAGSPAVPPPPSRPVIPIQVDQPAPPRQVPVARGCLTCEETDCHLHRPQLRGQRARQAWLLDGWTPEFARWLGARPDPGQTDHFLPVWPVWLPGHGGAARRWLQEPQAEGAPVITFAAAALRRALWQRLWARSAGRRQASVLTGQRWLAEAYARRLRPEHTHLVIDQGLLPDLQRLGALGGRRYQVLARALPMDEVERRLDRAQRQDATGDATLRDFRAAPALLALEAAAMRGASRVITAHAAVARHWAARALAVEQLTWQPPAVAGLTSQHMPGAPPLIVFPASPLARKGFHELAAALRGMAARLLILGTPPPQALALPGVNIEYGRYSDDWIARADAVALPAHIEHNPRALLRAAAAGIPVIATPACGLEPGGSVRLVPAGDAAALRQTIELALRGSNASAAGKTPTPSAP